MNEDSRHTIHLVDLEDDLRALYEVDNDTKRQLAEVDRVRERLAARLTYVAALISTMGSTGFDRVAEDCILDCLDDASSCGYKKINAIKLHRERTSMSLADSKNAIKDAEMKLRNMGRLPSSTSL